MAIEEYPLKYAEIMKHYRIVRDYLCRICLAPFERYEDDDTVCKDCDEDDKLEKVVNRNTFIEPPDESIVATFIIGKKNDKEDF